MTKVSVAKSLAEAKKLTKVGKIEDAKRVYEEILKAFPGNKRAKEGLALLGKTSSISNNQPAQNEIEHLISLYHQELFSETISKSNLLLEVHSGSVTLWNILGASYLGIGNASQAEASFRRIIDLDPASSEGWYNLGVSLQKQNEPHAAISAYKEATKLDSSYVNAYNNMGLNFKDIGEFKAALEAYDKALELNPKYSEVHYNKGLVFQLNGQLQEALAANLEALSHKPDYVDAYLNIGSIYRALEDYEKAINFYKTAITLEPKFTEAYNNLGNTLGDIGKYEEAVSILSTGVQIDPNNAEIHNNLANIFKNQGKLTAAIKSYERAIDLNPNRADFFSNLGSSLRENYKFEEAIRSYNKAIELDDSFGDAKYNKAVALINMNLREEAKDLLHDVLERSPRLFEAYRTLTLIEKISLDSPIFSKIKELMGSEKINNEEMSQLYFALAKIYEDADRLQDSFEHLCKGNSLIKETFGYDIVKHRLLVDNLKKAQSRLNGNWLPKGTNFEKTIPIFIIGMPRSGTTLVEQIISNHSRVHGAGELSLIRDLGHNLAVGNIAPSSEVIKNIREAYFAKITELTSGEKWLVDKMPQNFLYVPIILAAFPEAKIIHVQRNPVATCWSNFKQYFTSRIMDYSLDLTDTLEYFKLYKNITKCWHDIYNNKIYSISYEKLTENAEREIKNLLKFIELDFEPKCLTPERNDRVVMTASQTQIRKPIYSGSSQNWKKFEPFIERAFDEIINNNVP
ncbi:tetratricopeptide repeat protein [Rhodobacteraceae bacterium nBUS_22]